MLKTFETFFKPFGTLLGCETKSFHAAFSPNEIAEKFQLDYAHCVIHMVAQIKTKFNGGTTTSSFFHATIGRGGMIAFRIRCVN